MTTKTKDKILTIGISIVLIGLVASAMIYYWGPSDWCCCDSKDSTVSVGVMDGTQRRTIVMDTVSYATKGGLKNSDHPLNDSPSIYGSKKH